MNVAVKSSHSSTDGSIIFVFSDSQGGPKAVFTGGTLLHGGCGPFKVHEIEKRMLGTPSSHGAPGDKTCGAKEMFQILNDIIGAMDDEDVVSMSNRIYGGAGESQASVELLLHPYSFNYLSN